MWGLAGWEADDELGLGEQQRADGNLAHNGGWQPGLAFVGTFVGKLQHERVGLAREREHGVV